MADLNAKHARQLQAIAATRTSITKLGELAATSKDEKFKLNAHLILAQLNTKLRRQIAAEKLTQFQLELNL